VELSVFIFSNTTDLLSRLGYVLDDLRIGIRFLAVAKSLRHRLFQASVQRVQTIDFPVIRRLVPESDHTPFNADVVTACSLSPLLYTSPWRLRNYAHRHIDFGRLFIISTFTTPSSLFLGFPDYFFH